MAVMTWFDQLVSGSKTSMVAPTDALPGRAEPLAVSNRHFVNGNPIKPPFPEDMHSVVLAGGCFWGVEEIYWQLPGVYTTAVGYVGGYTPNPTYEEVCSAKTGHAEAVLVVFNPEIISFEQVMKVFWETHDPTQGMRQGNDVGTQYRSAIYVTDPADLEAARASADKFGAVLAAEKLGDVTTEIDILGDRPFYYAEEYHQQYLAKNPNGYRCHASTGLKYPA